MPQLRLTLLVVGLVFLAGLAWWELRRPHQVRGSNLPRPGPEPLERSAERLPERGMDRLQDRSADWDLPPLDLPRMSARDPDADLPVVEVEPEQFAALEADAEESSPPLATPAAQPAAAAEPPDDDAVEFGSMNNLMAEIDADGESDPPIFDMTGVFKETAARSLDPPMSAPERIKESAKRAVADAAAELELDFGPLPPVKTHTPQPEREPEALPAPAAEPVAEVSSAVVEPAMPVTEAIQQPEVPEVQQVDPESTDVTAPHPELPAAAIAAPVPAAPETPPEPVPAGVVVDWPAPDVSKIIAVRLVSGNEKFSGRAVRMALSAEGFTLGTFDIFHKPAPNGRALLSVASLAKPGTFNAESVDMQRYSGLNLFAVLPGPLPGSEAVEELLACAQVLCQRLRGTLQDDQGEPLNSVRTALLRNAAAAAPV